MKIGLICEDGEQRALVEGLIRRGWCPNADIELGQFKGMKGRSLRRDMPKALWALREKNADFLVVLTDADEHRWQDVREEGINRVPAEYRHLLVFGVPDRNVECWIVADPRYFADRIGCTVEDLLKEDPEMPVKRAIRRVGRWANAPEAISELISDPAAPIGLWISHSPSFERFYEDCRDVAQQNGCHIPNERDRR